MNNFKIFDSPSFFPTKWDQNRGLRNKQENIKSNNKIEKRKGLRKWNPNLGTLQSIRNKSCGGIKLGKWLSTGNPPMTRRWGSCGRCIFGVWKIDDAEAVEKNYKEEHHQSLDPYQPWNFVAFNCQFVPKINHFFFLFLG